MWAKARFLDLIRFRILKTALSIRFWWGFFSPDFQLRQPLSCPSLLGNKTYMSSCSGLKLPKVLCFVSFYLHFPNSLSEVTKTRFVSL